MSWEMADTFGNAMGAAASFLQGQQKAKDRDYDRKFDADSAQRASDATANAALYQQRRDSVADRNATTNEKREADATADRKAAEAEKVANDLRIDARSRLQMAQTAINQSNMIAAKKQIAYAQIAAREKTVEEQIDAGKIKDADQLAVAYARIDAMVQDNIRTTTASTDNNTRTNKTAERDTDARDTTSIKTNAKTVSGAGQRADASNALRDFSIKQTANNAAAAAGNPLPYPDLKSPNAAAAPNPDVQFAVDTLKSHPKAQRAALLTSSNLFKNSDQMTQQAMLKAVQAIP